MKNRIVLLLGIPENVPLSPTHAVPMTLETAAGNHVILSLRNGHYAFYAHLQPGSIRVKPGDRVRRGQVLGLLGNSGNSNAPHLHFHISNGNSWVASEGVPFLFDSFEVLGSAEIEIFSLLKVGQLPQQSSRTNVSATCQLKTESSHSIKETKVRY